VQSAISATAGLLLLLLVVIIIILNTLGSIDPKGYKLRVKNKAGMAIGLDSRRKRNRARAQN